jgi:hypothetical protein
MTGLVELDDFASWRLRSPCILGALSAVVGEEADMSNHTRSFTVSSAIGYEGVEKTDHL